MLTLSDFIHFYNYKYQMFPGLMNMLSYTRAMNIVANTFKSLPWWPKKSADCIGTNSLCDNGNIVNPVKKYNKTTLSTRNKFVEDFLEQNKKRKSWGKKESFSTSPIMEKHNT